MGSSVTTLSLVSLKTLLPALHSLFTLNMYVVFASNPFTEIIFSCPTVGKDFQSPVEDLKWTMYLWTVPFPSGDSSHRRVIPEALIAVAKGFPGLPGGSNSIG